MNWFHKPFGYSSDEKSVPVGNRNPPVECDSVRYSQVLGPRVHMWFISIGCLMWCDVSWLVFCIVLLIHTREYLGLDLCMCTNAERCALDTTTYHVFIKCVADRKYGLQIYWVISSGQPIRGGPPAWGLGEGLTTPHHKTLACYEMLHRVSDLDEFFETT